MYLIKINKKNYLGYIPRVNQYGDMVLTGKRGIVSRIFAEEFSDVYHAMRVAKLLGIQDYVIQYNKQ